MARLHEITILSEHVSGRCHCVLPCGLLFGKRKNLCKQRSTGVTQKNQSYMNICPLSNLIIIPLVIHFTVKTIKKKDTIFKELNSN